MTLTREQILEIEDNPKFTLEEIKRKFPKAKITKGMPGIAAYYYAKGCSKGRREIYEKFEPRPFNPEDKGTWPDDGGEFLARYEDGVWEQNTFVKDLGWFKREDSEITHYLPIPEVEG